MLDRLAKQFDRQFMCFYYLVDIEMAVHWESVQLELVLLVVFEQRFAAMLAVVEADVDCIEHQAIHHMVDIDLALQIVLVAAVEMEAVELVARMVVVDRQDIEDLLQHLQN